ncbi:MAG: DNA-formamidopyrimidine glycosylase family protein [Candidatus Bipolaricaulota bacterium]
MPELPDVEVYRNVLASTALSRRIASVEIHTGKVVEGLAEEEFQRRLTGQRFSSALRHGKYLFAGLISGDLLAMHFGMTGELVYLEQSDPLPEHTRCLFQFENGHLLVYTSQRQLGKLLWIEDLEAFVRSRELGPDAMDPGLVYDAFCQRVSARQATLKSVLMDQSTLAGIGNIYSDEILFQAELSPKRKAGELTDEELARLYKALREVLHMAIEADAEPARMPERFLIRCRAQGGNCPRCGRQLRALRMGGRRSWFCPECQR